MIITRAIGIDLGTTNSAVALLDPNERDLILWKDDQGRATVPSCVLCDPRKGDIVVGYRAYARKGLRPEPVSSIKRSMGTQMTVELGGKMRTPVEISAYILRELKGQMEAELKKTALEGVQYDVSRAIITVPAYFGLPAIEATRKAGELAGLEVTELLHEPTAAAIYYSWKHDLGDGNYLVYDLGGGTFDVSILQRTGGEFQVLGISGDIFLGGDDFDRRLAEHIRTLLVAEGYDMNLDVNSDPEDRLRFNQLMTIAESVKKELSDREEVILRNQGMIKDKAGMPVIIETPILRSTFEKLIEDLLDRTIVFCEDALEKARLKSGITIENIDHILLVGGSTYVPAVLQKVKKAFCEKPPKARCILPIRDEPETAVALGAALRAAASGLGIGDDDGRLRLWFRGTGATRNEQTNINGIVEPLDGSIKLEGGYLRLMTAEGELLGEVGLKSNRSFAFQSVDLRAESLNAFTFEVLDSQRKRVAALQRSIVQSSDQKEAVGSTLSTSVLSKPILLEGTDGSRLLRQVLLADGTSLPAKSAFTFAVSDPSGSIRLPIYQESRIIKELSASIGNVPVGTPVIVEIECDERVHIQVRFMVGDKEFGGQIDPPPEDAIPNEFDIQQIDDRFYEARKRLDKEDADRLGEAYKNARKDLDEARAGGDYPKVIQRAADLGGLLREARLAEPLRPPLETVEGNYNACIELIPQATKVTPVADTLKVDLKMSLDRAKLAYKRRDRRAYEDATKMIDTSLKFLAAVIQDPGGKGMNIDDATRATMAVEKTKGAVEFVMLACILKKKTEYIDGLIQRATELEELKNRATKDPITVINRCQVLLSESQRIFKDVSPEDKANAELEGLLRVDTQKAAGIAGTQKGMFGR